MMAQIIFRKYPFFQGKDLPDMIIKVSKILGSQGLFEMITAKKYEISQLEELKAVVGKQAAKPFAKFLDSKNEKLATEQAQDLIQKFLVYNPDARISAKDALTHPYFADL